MNKLWGVLFILLFFFSSAHAWEARCVSVADGDTITVSAAGQPQVRVRLYGIDAPEKKQPYGKRSKDYLAGLVFGEIVDVTPMDTDRYGRPVAIVRVNNVSANEEMVRAGMAWVFERYCKAGFCREWRKLEQDARVQRTGLWEQAKPVPPWEQRKK